MANNIVIEPMSEEFILWRCLHSGPLSLETIENWPADSTIDWEHLRERNLALLKALTRAYGACAFLARSGSRIVGQLRFYPRVVWERQAAGELCLQQDYPNGPVTGLAEMEFPPLSQISDKTLLIHCLMTGSPQLADNPFQRKGIGSRLVRCLAEWAKARGWERIEVDAFEDLPLIYEITGSAGITFWNQLGFKTVDRHPHPHLLDRSEFVDTIEKQAASVGIPPEKARDRIIMRLHLG
jgi:GNAT superfamily N-acetyltransferase